LEYIIFGQISLAAFCLVVYQAQEDKNQNNLLQLLVDYSTARSDVLNGKSNIPSKNLRSLLDRALVICNQPKKVTCIPKKQPVSLKSWTDHLFAQRNYNWQLAIKKSATLFGCSTTTRHQIKLYLILASSCSSISLLAYFGCFAALTVFP
jgi:hypothetical protein